MSEFKKCGCCGQDLPERVVEDFDYWTKLGIQISYRNAGGYIWITDSADPDSDMLQVSPEFALEVAQALKACAQEVLNRRKP